MRYVKNIELEKLIVHILDPSHANGKTLSQRTLPLEESPKLVEYFQRHIQNSLQDPATKAARFANLESPACQLCTKILNGSQDLVLASRALADLLYQAMGSDKRISGGDLAVALYRADAGSGATQYLSLMKIDPTDAFRHMQKRDSQNRLYVTFELEPDVMPTTREKLQKCAFVQALQPRPADYDMMLLDKQEKQVGALAVAKFFAEGFLGAELAMDDRERTDRLYRSLVSAQNLLRPQLTPVQDEQLRQAIDGAMAAQAIDLDAFIAPLALAQSQKDMIEQVVSQALPDREFAIDASYAQQLVQKRHFRGDHGMRLTVSAEHYHDMVESVEVVTEAGGPDYHRITLRSREWKEIMK
jgi:hypothetical protein